MYDIQERKKTKEDRIRSELQRLPTANQTVYYNVFNICDKYLFERKMKENFRYLEFKVREVDEDENCLSVSVSRTIGEDFLIIDGERFGNLDISLYLDDQKKEESAEEEEVEAEAEAVVEGSEEGKGKGSDWKTQFMQEMSGPVQKTGLKRATGQKSGKRQRLSRA